MDTSLYSSPLVGEGRADKVIFINCPGLRGRC